MIGMARKPKVSAQHKNSIDSELSNVAATLKARRVEMGWTQSDLAEKLDCEITTVQAYEQRRRTPSLATLFMICKIMKLKLSIRL